MNYDVEVARGILRAFGRPQDDYVDTDQLLQAVPSITGQDPETIRAHFNRLVEVGLLHPTREIQMTNRADPVTWRTTDAGREWVWRAWRDEHWEAEVPTLVRLLEGGNSNPT